MSIKEKTTGNKRSGDGKEEFEYFEKVFFSSHLKSKKLKMLKCQMLILGVLLHTSTLDLYLELFSIRKGDFFVGDAFAFF